MSIFTYCRPIAAVLFLLQTTLAFAQPGPVPARQDTLGRIAEEEQKRLVDPATNRVPYERLQTARQQLANQSATSESIIN